MMQVINYFAVLLIISCSKLTAVLGFAGQQEEFIYPCGEEPSKPSSINTFSSITFI
jgi:hypothetical protein